MKRNVYPLNIIRFIHVITCMRIPFPFFILTLICYLKVKIFKEKVASVQFSSVQLLSHVRLCDPMNCSTPGLPVHHQLPEFTQIHVHRVRDAIQPSHPLSSPSPPAPNPSPHQSLFQWISSLHQVAKVLEFQLQHQSFQWIFRTSYVRCLQCIISFSLHNNLLR